MTPGTGIQQITCGVYRSENCELVETEKFALVYYCSDEEGILGTKLYAGLDKHKKLVAVCQYNQASKQTHYAYRTINGSVYSNHSSLQALLGESYDCNRSKSMRLLESFFVDHSRRKLPTVNEVGIKNCLQSWRMYDSLEGNENCFRFYLNTGITEYIFQINPQDTNIYCGASYNIPFDMGLLGGRQFFRIRNFGDNSAPWCGFHCDFSYEAENIQIPTEECRLGGCVQTTRGVMWGVKRYTDDEIVLQGCGTDEYIYCRDVERTESFVREL